MRELSAGETSIADLDFFRGLSPDLLTFATTGASIQKTKTKEALFHEGTQAERFAIVMKGAFLLSHREPRENRVALSFAVRNDPIGLMIMTNPEPRYPVTCESMRAGVVLWIPRITYLENWIQVPELVVRVQNAFSDRMHWMIMDRVGHRLPLEVRLAGFLLKAKERSPGLYLSRKDLADAVGASVESVIRVMTHWERRGLVATTSQFIDIFEPEILEEIYLSLKPDEDQSS
jgi:CRP-like cAMP-binding protein